MLSENGLDRTRNVRHFGWRGHFKFRVRFLDRYTLGAQRNYRPQVGRPSPRTNAGTSRLTPDRGTSGNLPPTGTY